MNKWLYNYEEVNSIKDLPQNTFGFIYKILHIPTGKSYIGKKSLYHNVKKKLTKKELKEQIGPGRKPTHITIQKESDWRTYYGSHDEIKTLIKEKKEREFRRFILEFAYNKKHLTYLECKHLFVNEVLEKPDEYFNTNILGKFFKKDLDF